MQAVQSTLQQASGRVSKPARVPAGSHASNARTVKPRHNSVHFDALHGWAAGSHEGACSGQYDNHTYLQHAQAHERQQFRREVGSRLLQRLQHASFQQGVQRAQGWNEDSGVHSALLRWHGGSSGTGTRSSPGSTRGAGFLSRRRVLRQNSR